MWKTSLRIRGVAGAYITTGTYDRPEGVQCRPMLNSETVEMSRREDEFQELRALHSEGTRRIANKQGREMSLQRTSQLWNSYEYGVSV